MTRDKLYFLLLNVGHFLDHLFMLVFATAAALALRHEWTVSYSELLAYATPGFVAFGVFALPAGWLADKWSRDGMMCIFFIGIGIAAILTSLAISPLQIGAGLFLIGVFAAIYHPVGLAIVTMRWSNTGMRIAANGVWGNLGVASAALITGYMIDHGGWRMAFILPGIFSIAIGLVYLILRWPDIRADHSLSKTRVSKQDPSLNIPYRRLLIRVSTIVFLTTAISSIIFQSTTFALPKMFDERLQGLADRLASWSSNSTVSAQGDIATVIGALAFAVFAIASIAQLVVGSMLDRYGPRKVFMILATMQLVFFSAMPGLTDGLALVVALGFMLGAFGQIPINESLVNYLSSV